RRAGRDRPPVPHRPLAPARLIGPPAGAYRVCRMADGLIAVAGAAGAVGGKVAELLAARGIAQRLVVRDPARAPELPGVESVRPIADYGHADDVRRAPDGGAPLFRGP